MSTWSQDSMSSPDHSLFFQSITSKKSKSKNHLQQRIVIECKVFPWIENTRTEDQIFIRVWTFKHAIIESTLLLLLAPSWLAMKFWGNFWMTQSKINPVVTSRMNYSLSSSVVARCKAFPFKAMFLKRPKNGHWRAKHTQTESIS